MRRGALYAVRWQSNTKARKQQQLFCSNVENLKQELNKLRQQTDGVHLHLHVDNTTGYVSPIFFIPSSNTFLYDGKNPIQAPMVPVQQSSTMENILIPIVCLTKQFGKVFQTCPVTQTQWVSGAIGSFIGFEMTAGLNDIPMKYRPLAYSLSQAKKVGKSLCSKVRKKPDSILPTELLPPHHAAAAEYSSSISVNSESSVNTQALVAHVHGFHLQ